MCGSNDHNTKSYPESAPNSALAEVFSGVGAESFEAVALSSVEETRREVDLAKATSGTTRRGRETVVAASFANFRDNRKVDACSLDGGVTNFAEDPGIGMNL